MHEVFSKQCPMVLFLLNKTISMRCKRDFNIALNIKRENWASLIFHLLGPRAQSHQSPKKLLTFSFQIKKGTLYPAVIGIATLTQGALNGFWSVGNERNFSRFFFFWTLNRLWVLTSRSKHAWNRRRKRDILPDLLTLWILLKENSLRYRSITVAP